MKCVIMKERNKKEEEEERGTSNKVLADSVLFFYTLQIEELQKNVYTFRVKIV